MNIADRNNKRISSFVKILEGSKTVAFSFNEFYYEIFESTDSGFIVNVYTDDEKDEDGYYLDKNILDGGLCSGSSRNAVEFML